MERQQQLSRVCVSMHSKRGEVCKGCKRAKLQCFAHWKRHMPRVLGAAVGTEAGHLLGWPCSSPNNCFIWLESGALVFGARISLCGRCLAQLLPTKSLEQSLAAHRHWGGSVGRRMRCSSDNLPTLGLSFLLPPFDFSRRMGSEPSAGEKEGCCFYWNLRKRLVILE